MCNSQKRLLFIIFLSSILVSCKSSSKLSTTSSTVAEEVSYKTKGCCKERLGFPFGTILELKVEIVDGHKYYKGYRPDYLMKVLEINNKKIKEAMILEFDDWFLNIFPSDSFDLYKKLYGKEVDMLDDEQVQKMNKNYVGKVYRIAAYETGKFEGIPNGYIKYAFPPKAPGFYFKNYLRVISDLADNKKE